MLTLKAGARFKRDLKICEKRNLPMKDLRNVIKDICEGKTLDIRYRDHQLKGNFKGYRECHIQPDWLFIYSTDENTLYAMQTGTHADIYGL